MFTVIRGGCFSRHSSDFIINRPNGLPYYVLLIIKSDSELNIGSVHQSCKPNSILLIRPNTPYSYQNPHGEYVDDWIHFDCISDDLNMISEDMFNRNFPINNTRLLTTYLQQLLWENNYCDTASKDYYTDSLFKILFKHICDDFHSATTDEYNPYKYKFQSLRMDIQAAPYKKYTAKDISKTFDISTSHFQYLYKKVFGISFQADIINMRIDYSKELIASTNLPQEQIAYSCGYSSEVHFYRQFLDKTGMTPGEYRKIYST